MSIRRIDWSRDRVIMVKEWLMKKRSKPKFLRNLKGEFTLGKNRSLLYRNVGDNFDIIIQSEEDNVKFLRNLYEKSNKITGGMKKIYNTLSPKYNITHSHVREALHGSNLWSITQRGRNTKKNEGMVISRKKGVVECDLMVMNLNKNEVEKNQSYKGLLVCVDRITNFVAVRPYKNRDAKTIGLLALQCFRDMPFTVKLVLTDLGSEFGATFQKILNSKNIALASSSYTGGVQPVVENMNGQIRTEINKRKLTTGNDIWINKVRDVISSINRMKLTDARRQYSPLQLARANDDIIQKIYLALRKSKYKKLEDDDLPKLDINDRVRVVTESQKKMGIGHKSIQKWSGKVYIIAKILIRKETGLPVFVLHGLPKRRFTRSMLQKVNDSQKTISKYANKNIKFHALGVKEMKNMTIKQQRRGNVNYKKSKAVVRPNIGEPGSTKRLAYNSRKAALQDGWKVGDLVFHKTSKGIGMYL